MQVLMLLCSSTQPPEEDRAAVCVGCAHFWHVGGGLKAYFVTRRTRDGKKNLTFCVFSTCSVLHPDYQQACIDELTPIQQSDHNLEAWSAKLADVPLLHDPGAEWYYGIDGDLLGRLVEVWSGDTLDVFFRREIFEPLGMEDTFFFIEDDDPKFVEYQSRLLDIVSWDGVELGTDPNIGGVRGINRVMSEGPRTFFGGGAGLFSTVGDFGKLGNMLANNYYGHGSGASQIQLLSATSLQYASQPHVSRYLFYTPSDESWGLGFSTNAGADVFKSGDSLSFGWGGAASTIFRVVPDRNLYWVGATAVLPEVPEGSAFFTDFVDVYAQSLFTTQDATVTSVPSSSASGTEYTEGETAGIAIASAVVGGILAAGAVFFIVSPGAGQGQSKYIATRD
jgi:CubicO group peptidase (beta-lactamase class C family)